MAKGQAQELPTGRLASFEEDDESDFASILGPRRGASKDADAATEPPSANHTRKKTAGDDQGPAVTTDAPHGAPAPATRAQKKSATTAQNATEAPTSATPVKESAGGTEVPAYSKRQNEIRSSSVHIPAQLLEKLVAFRDEHGMSNGQVVIAAIEKAHPKLPELIHPVTAGGGGLFAQRATRGVRTTEGPLTPLNVRLYTQDYEVIDRLVEEFGAYSRGHLVTVSLTEFFS